MKPDVEARLSGGLILTTTLLALAVMMHHPTSLHGPDDGRLLRDWSNTAVHGAMIACLVIQLFAFSTLPRLLGKDRLSVRGGWIAFVGGSACLIVAALINGFAMASLAGGDPQTLGAQIAPLMALNRAFAGLGLILVATATACWAVRMFRLGGWGRGVGGVGLAVAGLAAAWFWLAGGAFGLLPALLALTAFAAWSSAVAAWMMRGTFQPQETGDV
jgi:hypothetical protein